MSGNGDVWSQWLLRRRHGGDEATRAAIMQALTCICTDVLEHAGLQAGDTLLDVGCGDGLIGFGALSRDPSTSVVFSDISEELLETCAQLADGMGVAGRCQYVKTSADGLEAIADESVNVVTTRSVLIYVQDKLAAMQAFHRVLRPAGRISLFEPINRFPVKLPMPEGSTFWGYDVRPVAEIARKLTALYKGGSTALTPMTDLDERDLVRLATEAGFAEVNLDLQIRIGKGQPRTWEGFVDASPNPLAPTLSEAMDEALTRDETSSFVAYLKPLVESGALPHKSAVAYLWARKNG